VRKLIFWLLILSGMSYSVPSIRERVAPRVVPVRDYLIREVGPPLQRGLDPVYRWLAMQEMREIARELRRRGLSFHPLPQPREFSRFLDEHLYIRRGSLDPWETPYYLTITGDSIVIGSAGPDRERGTEDDLRHSAARR
jgi:hypothetical protein